MTKLSKEIAQTVLTGIFIKGNMEDRVIEFISKAEELETENAELRSNKVMWGARAQVLSQLIDRDRINTEQLQEIDSWFDDKGVPKMKLNLLPGCMMPDGAEPCKAFIELYNRDDELEKENAKLKTQIQCTTQWISIKDNPPKPEKKDDLIIIWYGNDYYFTFADDYGFDLPDIGFIEKSEVKFWFPLPKEPKDE